MKQHNELLWTMENEVAEKVKAENERLKEELLRLRTPLHLHHRLDETAALAAKEGK